MNIRINLSLRIFDRAKIRSCGPLFKDEYIWRFVRVSESIGSSESSVSIVRSVGI